MSLNGLDASEVDEAYQSALAEGGGWFLLKYASRDEVTLLKKGNGGIQELREAVSQYGEQSPLFGFAHYRRRKVVLKYVPDGTSRLLQARLTVHFQAVSEKLTPHDTVYSFSSPIDLRDNALSSACSLHTASASIKSSNSSLRQRNLAEIVEDAEEVPIAVAPSGSAINGTLDETRLERSSTSRDRAQSSANGLEESPVRSSRSFRDIMKALPPTPSKVEEKSDLGNDDTRQSEDADVFTEPRPSASTRPPTWDYYTGFDYKPKVKLGPRPSQEAGSTAQASNHYRPVSSLPAGVQMPKRKLIPSRTDSQTLYAPSRHTVSSQGSTVIAPPPTPNSNFRIPERPSTSQSNKTIIRSSPSEMKQNGMTPEKRRLMKAVQIRQRQLAAQAAAIENSTPSTSEVLCNNSTFLETENETRRPKTEIYSPTKQAASEEGASDKLTDMREAERKDRCPTEADFANPEASPVSFHDISDGVSTKPSSLSSEDDSETPKKQEVPSVLSERRDGPADAMSDLHAQQLRDAPTNDPTEAMITIDPEKLVIEEQTPRKEISSGPNLAMVEETLAPLDIKETVTVIRDEPIDAAAPDQIPLPPIDGKEIMELERRPLTIGISADDNEQSILTRPSTGATRPSTADTNGLRSGEQPGKRKAPESLKRVSSPDHSEDHFLSDDSFLEELKSATVQEAKPISVSKSPITPVFPRSLSDSREDTIRSFSMPQAYHECSANAMPVPEIPRLLSPRSASASHSHSHTNNLPQATPSLKKVGVSSGISQRIKALEKLSSRPTSPGTQTSSAATPASATAFPALSSRKTSLRSRPSTSETGQTLSSPVVEKLFVVPQGSRPTDSRSNPASAPLRPEPVNIKPALDTDRASNYLTPNEQQSSDQPSSPTIFKKPAIKRHTTSPSVSSNSVANQRRSDSVPTSKRDSIISRLSSSANISRRGSEAEIPRSPSESSLMSGVTSLGGEDGRDGEKKESRKSRLLKRMSNLSAVSRKSIVSALSPPVKEGPILEHVEPTLDHTKLDKPQSVELGDVNIQFPDSLLWRRRHAQIDGGGNLVLAPSKADNHSRVQVKHFPLSAFHAPYIPDLDAQELPHSVNLDFRDGSTLQCACETPAEQMHILGGLRKGWDRAVR